MEQGDQKLTLIEQFAEKLGERQSITVDDVRKILKKEKLAAELDIDEVMDYLAASGVTIIDAAVTKSSETPLAMYFKDIGDVSILGKEKELLLAQQMRRTIAILRDMIPLTTVSIKALLRYGALLEKGDISIDEFTISSFRPDAITPTEHRNDILMALVRIAISYQKMLTFVRNSRKASMSLRTYWERKGRFVKKVDEDMEFINPSFKIIEDILPVFKKISVFYLGEKKHFEETINLAGVGADNAKAIYEADEKARKRLAKKFALGESTMHGLVQAYKRYERVEHRMTDISLLPLSELEEKIKSFDSLLTQYELDRETLVKANVRLVVNIARNYMNQGVDFLDLIQDGNHALLKAVERFDPGRGYKLSTYAIWWVRQAMIRSIAEQGNVIRLPAYLIQWARKYSHIVQELSQTLRREPTPEEVSEELGITRSELEETLQALQGQVSLERKLGHDEDSRTLSEIIEDQNAESPSLQTTLNVLQQEIQKILSTLSQREAQVISLRFGLDDNFPRTLEEIGKMFGLSRERVRQIESKALGKLRHPTKLRLLEAFIKE